jgi:8-oxo-dGTP diphosphatase
MIYHSFGGSGKMKQPTETVVAIALVRSGDSFLVGKRGHAGPLPGCDEFPGGKCQAGETPEECVIRECREETGLDIIIIRRRSEVSHDYPHGRLRLVFFDCTTDDQRDPRRPFHWVPRAELAKLHFPEANQDILASLLANRLPAP